MEKKLMKKRKKKKDTSVASCLHLLVNRLRMLTKMEISLIISQIKKVNQPLAKKTLKKLKS